MCLTHDAELAQRLRELRNHGQGVPGVFQRASGNYRLSEIAAGLGIAQLGKLDGMLVERGRLAARYNDALARFTPQRLPEGARSNHQTFGIVLPNSLRRDAIIGELRALGVEAARLSYALHTLPQFSASASEAAAAGRTFPEATRIAEQGIALPLWPGLSADEQRHVIASLLSVIR
jgi:dTDP-4-amino-4,6-dideoxygalactose transaminase